MTRVAAVLILVASLTFSGCLASPERINAPNDDALPSLQTSTSLTLDREGWVRYTVDTHPGKTVHATLLVPPAIDPCHEGARRDVFLTTADFFAVALYGSEVSNAAWTMFFGDADGWPSATGTSTCEELSLKLEPEAHGYLVVATTIPGVAVEIRMDTAHQLADTTASLTHHPGFRLLEPAPERSGISTEGPVAIGTKSQWVAKSEGGPRLIHARSWDVQNESIAPTMAHAELASHEFSVTGIDNPRNASHGALEPGFGYGSATMSWESATGFASGEAPVVAKAARERPASVVIGAYSEGLTVWQVPLVPDDGTVG